MKYNTRFNYIENDDIIDGQPIRFPIENDRNSEESIQAFDVIPGRPIAYWAGKKMLSHFTNSKSLSDLFDLKQGLITADNDRFLRYWQEVNFEKIGINQRDRKSVV